MLALNDIKLSLNIAEQELVSKPAIQSQPKAIDKKKRDPSPEKLLGYNILNGPPVDAQDAKSQSNTNRARLNPNVMISAQNS
jgi:hypothetical protein